MNISRHLDKDNLHHAYLVEGARDEVVGEVLSFCENIDIKTSVNPYFFHISIDNFKIEEAFSLRAMSTDKSFSPGKKIYIVCTNSMSLDAQNVLLKMFEEPIENTIFFLIVPDINALLPTLISRFYLIKSKTGLENELSNAEKFISMSLRDRIDFIKELLIEPKEEDEDGNEVVVLDSTRTQALKFLNALESVAVSKTVFYKNMSRTVLDIRVDFFEHIFKVREFLRMPGSSTKTLMESVAIIVPSFQN